MSVALGLPHDTVAGIMLAACAALAWLIAPRMVAALLARARANPNIITLARHGTQALSITAGVLLVLPEFGVVAPSIFGAAFLGLALGTATGSILQAGLDGVYLLVEDRVRVGQVIQVNNTYTGAVVDIKLRYTELADPRDGSAIVLPNTVLFTGVIKVLSETALAQLPGPSGPADSPVASPNRPA